MDRRAYKNPGTDGIRKGSDAEDKGITLYSASSYTLFYELILCFVCTYSSFLHTRTKKKKNCLCFHAICLIDSVASNMLKIGDDVAAKKNALGI